MEGLILDKNFDTLDIIDVFGSFIWVDRFLGYGDFEIDAPANSNFIRTAKQDNYIALKNIQTQMIIEQLELITDVENGNRLIISGRSLEALLERRIIWGQKTLTGNFQLGIKELLDENIINPTIKERKIPNFTFRASEDPDITKLTIEAQFTGDNLYDAIFALCEEKHIGFRVLPDGPASFIFELYKGINRSYNQTDVPYVIFSPKFENLLSSNYIETKKAFKTTALVGGEGEGSERIMTDVSLVPDVSGLERREMFVDAGGISSHDEDENISQESYLNLLKTNGLEKLTKTESTALFEGEIDSQKQFVYGKDFFIGDIVQIINEYGMEAQSQVSELIITHNEEGESFIPTFTTVDDILKEEV